MDALEPLDATQAFPDIVKAHYIISVVDWDLACLSQGTTGKRGRVPPNVHLNAKLWALLVETLQRPQLQDNHTLPASLIVNITRALSDWAPSTLKSASTEEDHGVALLTALADVLSELRVKFHTSYSPSLEHIVGLLEAVLSAVEMARSEAKESLTVAAMSTATAALRFSISFLQ